MWELARAFEGEAGGLPFGEATLEGLDLREAGGAEFFRGGGGIERAFARAIHDDGRGWIEAELLHVIEEGGLIDAGIRRAGDVRGGEDFRRQHVEELGWLSGL